jgi:hypothetical protein
MISQYHNAGEEYRSFALFSDDEKYRYILERIWDSTGKRILFIMLNPSTADAKKNDPTVKRCCDYAKKWGYGSIVVCNLFAYRSTYPEALVTVENPVGEHNMEYIGKAMGVADKIVAAWGNNVLPNFHMHTVYSVVEKAREMGKDIYCLGTNDNGQPVHPLYQKGDITPIVWRKV